MIGRAAWFGPYLSRRPRPPRPGNKGEVRTLVRYGKGEVRTLVRYGKEKVRTLVRYGKEEIRVRLQL